MSEYKYYTVIDFPKSGDTYGKFKSKSPKRATKKAFSKLAKLTKIENGNGKFIVFTIMNIHTQKRYKYIGTRVKLVKPKEIIISGKKIIYKYDNVIGKYNKELNKINKVNK
jgi:hypothetical protein